MPNWTAGKPLNVPNAVNFQQAPGVCRLTGARLMSNWLTPGDPAEPAGKSGLPLVRSTARPSSPLEPILPTLRPLLPAVKTAWPLARWKLPNFWIFSSMIVIDEGVATPCEKRSIAEIVPRKELLAPIALKQATRSMTQFVPAPHCSHDGRQNRYQ